MNFNYCRLSLYFLTIRFSTWLLAENFCSNDLRRHTIHVCNTWSQTYKLYLKKYVQGMGRDMELNEACTACTRVCVYVSHMHTYTRVYTFYTSTLLPCWHLPDLYLCTYSTDRPLSWARIHQIIIRPCCASLIAMYSGSSLILYQMHWSLWASHAHWSTHSVWSQPISAVPLSLSVCVSISLVFHRFWAVIDFRNSWFKVDLYFFFVNCNPNPIQSMLTAVFLHSDSLMNLLRP